MNNILNKYKPLKPKPLKKLLKYAKLYATHSIPTVKKCGRPIYGTCPKITKA